MLQCTTHANSNATSYALQFLKTSAQMHVTANTKSTKTNTIKRQKYTQAPHWNTLQQLSNSCTPIDKKMHMHMPQHDQIVDKTNNIIIQYQEWCCNVQHMQTAMLHHMHCHSKQTLNTCMSQQTQNHKTYIQSRGKNQQRHPIGKHCNSSATAAHP